MSDLVARLRTGAELQDTQYGWAPGDKLLGEAADEIKRLRAREIELLNLIHEAMPYMLNAAASQEHPCAEWTRNASKAGGSLLAGYHAINLHGPADALRTDDDPLKPPAAPEPRDG